MTKVKRLLIIRLSAMGDVAMTSPITCELHKSYPELKLYVLTRPFFQPFYRDIPNISFIDLDFKGRHKGIIGIFKLYRDIMKIGKPDMVADLHDIIRTKMLRILFWLSGSRVVTIDKGRKEKKDLILGNKVALKTTPERYAEVFSKLGYPINIPRILVKKQAEIPDIFGSKDCRWIGVAPFAQHFGKRYPLDKMMEVIAMLAKNSDNKLFIFGGGKSEQEFAEKEELKMKNVVSVIGKVTLSQELDLISNLDIMISMDSAAMHMSSLQGVRVISVWGSTHPHAGFLGIGQNIDDTVSVDLDCRPCSIYGNKPCRKNSYECMSMISPTDIVKKVEQKMAATDNVPK